MSEERCPLCGCNGTERPQEREITQVYAEVAAAMGRERNILRTRVAELEEALADEQRRRHRVEVVSAFQAEALRRIRTALDWAEEAAQKGVEP